MKETIATIRSIAATDPKQIAELWDFIEPQIRRVGTMCKLLGIAYVFAAVAMFIPLGLLAARYGLPSMQQSNVMIAFAILAIILAVDFAVALLMFRGIRLHVEISGAKAEFVDALNRYQGAAPDPNTVAGWKGRLKETYRFGRFCVDLYRLAPDNSPLKSATSAIMFIANPAFAMLAFVAAGATALSLVATPTWLVADYLWPPSP